MLALENAELRVRQEPGQTAEAHLLTQVVLAVFRANGALLAAGDRFTHDIGGVTSARWQVLGVLDLRGPATVAQIARQQGLQRQSVWRLVDVLAAEGLVEFVDNPDHRRAKLVRMTPKGVEKYAILARRQVLWSNALAACFDGTELARTLELLRELNERIEAHTGEPPLGARGGDA